MFDRFTERARKVIALAREEAGRLGHDYIGTEHLLLGLIREGGGVAAAVLENLNVDLERVRLEVEKLVVVGGGTLTLGEVPFTPRAKKVLELSVEEAQSLSHNYIGTEHLLLGLVREGEGVAAKVLENLGVKLDKAREITINLLGGQSKAGSAAAGTGAAASKSATPALDTFGRDLTQMARDGKLDPVIGRENEIERVIQVLSRRTKNNPVLIGEPGVGKTSIAEGLAQRIISNNVPELLLNKRVVTLDLGAVVAGTKYRGEFEERLKAVMNELRHSASNIILVIDEIHTLVGAGAAEGAIDASSMLKPALQRGEVQCIGATTLNEYRKYIEKDGALERRFTTVMVKEPTIEQSIQIITGLRDRYEAYHRVRITDSAIEAAVKLSDRYVTGRFLPDKAIDLIDEAGAWARLRSATVPPDLRQMEAEIEAVGKEKDAAIKAQEFEKAARLRDKVRDLKLKKEEMKKTWDMAKDQASAVVTEEQVAQIVSKQTGIPLTRLEQKETAKLLDMESYLKRRVLGQDEAVASVSRAIRASRAGIADPNKPIGSFVFLGPTGVGKTELAKTLAEFLFDDEDALIRIDMSEYMEKFSTSALVGAPPGYVGHDEAGQLTEKVRRRPYSVVLFDEIEKAHPDVLNLMLQILDDGRLTDAQGRTVDFKNTVVILTSNLGTSEMQKNLGFASDHEDEDYEQMKSKLLALFKKSFRLEFINRLNEIVIFRRLTRKMVENIVGLIVAQVTKRVAERGITVEIDQAALDWIIEKGYDPLFGARPLKRVVKRNIEEPLAEEILKGTVRPGGTVRIIKPETDKDERLGVKVLNPGAEIVDAAREVKA
ncbi:MAG TPA: ATP-dependent Clp protease ATP-binding subunit [bacterium]|jgi:ATP-dependent Clp protease ATP-binding subunit ClpC|nr:ATP-dependent Clp protease ATP-binding subunit [bacterium]